MKKITELVPDFIGAEIVTLLYILFTLVLMLIYLPDMGEKEILYMLGCRTLVILYIIVTATILDDVNSRFAQALRTFPLMAMLIWWYPETYTFCSQLAYQDHVFANIDQWLFHCQPSLEFSRVLPGTVWSEAFNLGYYAYYYMMAATLIYYFVCEKMHYLDMAFTFLAAFFTFYVVFDLLPVAGPQYYFHALNEIFGIDPFVLTSGTPEAVAEAAKMHDRWPFDGMFPSMGYHFQHCQEAMLPEAKGLFSSLVHHAQEFGEHPTAAFPSSHVGMSTVVMLMAWHARRRTLFYIMLPLYVLLCCGTVYIRAHYAIDSICGLLCGIGLYYLYSRVVARRFLIFL